MGIFELIEFVLKYELLIASALAASAIVGIIISRGKASSPKNCDEDRRTFIGTLLFWLACLGTVFLCMVEAFSIFVNLLGAAFISAASSWVGTGDSDTIGYFATAFASNMLACIVSIGGIIVGVIIGRILKKKR